MLHACSYNVLLYELASRNTDNKATLLCRKLAHGFRTLTGKDSIEAEAALGAISMRPCAVTHMLTSYKKFKGSLKQLQDDGLKRMFENVKAEEVLEILDTTKSSKTWHGMFNLMQKVRFVSMHPFQMILCVSIGVATSQF
jgi:hypothetical protein